MASIEFAIDREGNRVRAREAMNKPFKCFYCLEKVNLRGGSYFAHWSIRNRTPLQQLCPGYTGKSSSTKTIDAQDQIYIENGGVPLYLVQTRQCYELLARFPRLSDDAMNALIQDNIQFCVNPSARRLEDKLYSHAAQLKYYNVRTINPWIDVTASGSVMLEEVKKKWLWGIRGLDFENDLYHVNEFGGYRLAVKANVVIQRHYRLISRHDPSMVQGVDFQKIGIIHLYTGSKMDAFGVYEMVVTNYTDSARMYIERKGYRLLEAVNDIIPIWPPAAYEGTDLNFEASEAWFTKLGKQQPSLRLPIRVKPIRVAIANSILLVPSEENDCVKEIRYNLNRVAQLCRKEDVVPKISLLDHNESNVDLQRLLEDEVFMKRIWIQSNLPFVALVRNGSYVTATSKQFFEHINPNYKYEINNYAFGICQFYAESAPSAGKMKLSIDPEEWYKLLSNCTIPNKRITPLDRRNIQWLLGKLDYSNAKMYRLASLWLSKGEVPYRAIEQINRHINDMKGGIVDG